MKISDRFKKKSEKSTFSKFEGMKKDQVSKVLGGDGGNTPPTTTQNPTDWKSRSNIQNN